MFKLPRKSKEELRRLMELRRSNSATPVRNMKKYSRTIKHKGKNADG